MDLTPRLSAARGFTLIFFRGKDYAASKASLSIVLIMGGAFIYSFITSILVFLV
jgi:hypothetical protein